MGLGTLGIEGERELLLDGGAGCATRDGVMPAPGLDPGQKVPHEPVVSALDHKGAGKP